MAVSVELLSQELEHLRPQVEVLNDLQLLIVRGDQCQQHRLLFQFLQQDPRRVWTEVVVGNSIEDFLEFLGFRVQQPQFALVPH